MPRRSETLGTLPTRRSILSTALAGAAALGIGAACAALKEGKGAGRVLRIPARMRRDVSGRITPLAYSGGFDTKTALYETLVRVDAAGRRGPGLAVDWSLEDGGTKHVLQLRRGALFHDGSPADAEAVRLHFMRWVGLPEHSWLASNERIVGVEALAEDVVSLRTDRPFDVIGDLLAINPCAIAAPSCFDAIGEWARPIGSGPLRFVSTREEGRRVRCEPAFDAAPRETSVEFVAYSAADARQPLDDLLSDDLDAVVDTWAETVPRQHIADLDRDSRFEVRWSPGGQLVFLAFRLDGGPTSDAAVRRFVAGSVDREKLAHAAELGYADACRRWAPQSFVEWPDAGPSRSSESVRPAVRLRMPRPVVASTEMEREERLHAALADQLRCAGIEVEVAVHPQPEFQEILRRGEYDLLLLRTHGVPYDPVLSLSRFIEAPRRPAASSSWRLLGDAKLTSLVHELNHTPLEASRCGVHARIQAHLDQEASVVPLYVPRRAAVVRRGWGCPRPGHDLYHPNLQDLVAPRVR